MDAERHPRKTLGKLTPINPNHLTRLIELGLVEMREDKPFVTAKGQDVAWISD
jgi:hypothetical protein